MKTAWIVIVMAVVINAEAGWFSKKKEATELKPIAGYVKETVLETNAWDVCVINYKKGVISENKIPDGIPSWVSKVSNVTHLLTTNSCCTVDINGLCINNEGMIWPKPEPCNKAHIDDWPKTTVMVTGIQRKNTTRIFLDGILVTTLTQYDFPHEKHTVTETTKIEYKIDSEKVIEKGLKESEGK